MAIRKSILILYVVALFQWISYASPWLGPKKTLVKEYMLEKPSGGVDQAIQMPDGRFLIRDADFLNETGQAIELYDEAGKFVRKIGGFGRSPGQYYRLTDLAVRDNEVWGIDFQDRRISVFGLDGELKRTRLVQVPAFQPTNLVLDEERGFVYLAGCLPTKTYLDLGCQLLHQYAIDDFKLKRSFWDTDPEALEKSLFSFEYYYIDSTDIGQIFAADAALFKLWRIDPESGEVQSYPIATQQAQPVTALLALNAGEPSKVYEIAYLIDRLVVVKGRVIVSIREPRHSGYLLQVFDLEGNQIATDWEAPGRLVGKSADNRNLFFYVKTGVKTGRTILVEYHVE